VDITEETTTVEAITGMAMGLEEATPLARIEATVQTMEPILAMLETLVMEVVGAMERTLVMERILAMVALVVTGQTLDTVRIQIRTI